MRSNGQPRDSFILCRQIVSQEESRTTHVNSTGPLASDLGHAERSALRGPPPHRRTRNLHALYDVNPDGITLHFLVETLTFDPDPVIAPSNPL